MNCNQQCVGHCIDGVSCNHVVGNCERGCAAGWKGDLCDEGIRLVVIVHVLNHFY